MQPAIGRSQEAVHYASQLTPTVDKDRTRLHAEAEKNIRIKCGNGSRNYVAHKFGGTSTTGARNADECWPGSRKRFAELSLHYRFTRAGERRGGRYRSC